MICNFGEKPLAKNTYPTLAAFCKYPRTAAPQNDDESSNRGKPGLFCCHTKSYAKIAEALEIPRREGMDAWCRHPLAFVTEAADDICYNIIDLEDGFALGLVTYDDVAGLLTPIVKLSDDEAKRLPNLDRIHDERNKLGYLRSLAIGSLIVQAYQAFFKYETAIMEGEFRSSLLSQTEADPYLVDIREMSKNRIYSHQPVLQIEAAGFQVLPGLLESFLKAVTDDRLSSSKKIAHILGDLYVLDYKKDPYLSIMNVVSYVAGMTDAYALETYRSLKGMQLPSLAGGSRRGG